MMALEEHGRCRVAVLFVGHGVYEHPRAAVEPRRLLTEDTEDQRMETSQRRIGLKLPGVLEFVAHAPMTAGTVLTAITMRCRERSESSSSKRASDRLTPAGQAMPRVLTMANNIAPTSPPRSGHVDIVPSTALGAQACIGQRKVPLNRGDRTVARSHVTYPRRSPPQRRPGDQAVGPDTASPTTGRSSPASAR
jgi:hypothetical protein